MKWVRRILLFALAGFALLAIFIVGAAFYGAGKMITRTSSDENRIIQGNPETALGLAYEDVSFKAEDGETLRGWFVPAASADVGVVTVHGLGANRLEFLRDAKTLHDSGYAVLMFDCRGHGMSDGSGRILRLGIWEHRDVEAAAAYLKQSRGIKRVIVFGCSQGAASAIEAAAEDKDIDAVIAEASILSPRDILTVATRRARPDLAPGSVAMMTWIAVWRMGGRGMPGPIDAITQIAPRPVLLMQGSADEAVPPNDVRVLFDQALEPKWIWVGEGAGHCELREKYPQQYRQHVIDFLTRYFPISK
jgi:alpha-beta hydrolase superfamily lysophospholipase